MPAGHLQVANLRRNFRQFLSAFPLQLIAVFLIQRRESRPQITADEQQQEWQREIVHGFNRKIHHVYEIRANRQFRVRQPTALAFISRFALAFCEPYLAVRAKLVWMPSSASITPLLLLTVSATPAAISIGRKAICFHQDLGYSTFWAYR